MYYNAEQKQKFLDSCEGSKQILSTSLQLVAPYESQLDVDCSEFTREQILNFYENNRNELHAINSYASTNWALKTYTIWCINNGYTDQKNYYDEIYRSDIIEMFGEGNVNRFLSRPEVEGILSKLENPVDKFIILGIYSGIKGKTLSELTLLSKEDILISSKEFILHKVSDHKRVPSRTIDVSDELIKIALDSANSYVYTKTDGREYSLYGDKVIKTFSDMTDITSLDDYVAKRGRNITVKLQNMTEKFPKLSNLSANVLFYSGIIDVIKTYAAEHKKSVSRAIRSNEL